MIRAEEGRALPTCDREQSAGDHYRGKLQHRLTLQARILQELRLQHFGLLPPPLPPLLPNELCNVLLILCALVNEH